jgi:transposase-like protein
MAARKKKAQRKAPAKKKRKHRSYTNDFKRDVVAFAIKHNSQARAARRFKVHSTLVGNWVRGGAGSPAPTPARATTATPNGAVGIYRDLVEKQEHFDTAMADLNSAKEAAGIPV